MHWTINPRRVAVVTALFLVPGAVLAAPAEAQEGERMRLLVPALANNSGPRNNFGRSVADEVRKRVDDMATHQPVNMRDLRDDLRKYGLKEEDLTNCITSQQLGAQTGIPLIMCGSYDEAGGSNTVNAKIVSTQTQEAFEIPPFQASDARQAAEHIVAQFESYTQQIQLAYYCNEYLESQQWENALDNCEKALAINPQARSALYGKATSLWKMDRDEEALAVFDQVIELDPLNQDAILSAALVATELGQKERAAGHFHSYLELNPGSLPVRLQIATEAANAGDPEAALRIIEEGMQGETVDAQMKMYAGHFAMNAATQKLQNAGANGNDAEAQALLQKALSYYEPVFAEMGNDVEPVVLRNMLQAYRRLEQHEKAVDFGRRATAAHPEDAQLLSTYADALNDAGQRTEALALLDRIAQLDPEYAVNARRGVWALEAGDLAAARTSLQRAQQRNEINEAQLDQIARQIAARGFQDRGRQGQHQAAMAYYEAAKEFATSAQSRGMIAFFEGYAIYQQADARMKDQTLANARATLPQFQRVITLMEQAAPWTTTQPQQEQNRRQIIEATRSHIEIAELLIQRGR